MRTLIASLLLAAAIPAVAIGCSGNKSEDTGETNPSDTALAQEVLHESILNPGQFVNVLPSSYVEGDKHAVNCLFAKSAEPTSKGEGKPVFTFLVVEAAKNVRDLPTLTELCQKGVDPNWRISQVSLALTMGDDGKVKSSLDFAHYVVENPNGQRSAAAVHKAFGNDFRQGGTAQVAAAGMTGADSLHVMGTSHINFGLGDFITQIPVAAVQLTQVAMTLGSAVSEASTSIFGAGSYVPWAIGAVATIGAIAVGWVPAILTTVGVGVVSGILAVAGVNMFKAGDAGSATTPDAQTTTTPKTDNLTDIENSCQQLSIAVFLAAKPKREDLANACAKNITECIFTANDDKSDVTRCKIAVAATACAGLTPEQFPPGQAAISCKFEGEKCLCGNVANAFPAKK